MLIVVLEKAGELARNIERRNDERSSVPAWGLRS